MRDYELMELKKKRRKRRFKGRTEYDGYDPSRDFGENSDRHHKNNKHYRSTKNRRFESLADEIVNERQDKNRRRFIRAKKRLMFNKMATIRSRKNDFRTDFSERRRTRCPDGMRMTESGC